MSWDADLTDDRGHVEGQWNYTHNTSRMIYDVLDRLPKDWRASARKPHDPNSVRWYEVLDGVSGPEGAEYLAALIDQLESNPAKYQAMNPPNGWGNYDGLLRVLREMRDAVPEWPCTWTASG